jgi:hypothetical protein
MCETDTFKAPTYSWHQVDPDRCNFHPLMPAFTIVSLLERYLVFETANSRGDIRKRPSAVCTSVFSCDVLSLDNVICLNSGFLIAFCSP